MGTRYFCSVLAGLLLGCAAASPSVVIWETYQVPREYEVLGPLSVREEMEESPQDIVQGIAGFISKDGSLSSQVPPEMREAWESHREKYKEKIYAKLAEKAKAYQADAVMGVTYGYVPPFATFSTKAVVTAKGTMIRYKK